jgi:hypothetical protein
MDIFLSRILIVYATQRAQIFKSFSTMPLAIGW